MAISVDQIKFYRSLTNNDLGGNGGRLGTTQIVAGILNNLFPNVSAAERIAGITRYRKCFIRNENPDEYTLENTYLWISEKSLAADYFHLKPGTDSDIQTNATGYTDWAGAGLLDVDANATDTSIDVDYDIASGVYDGSSIFIDDGTHTEVAVVNGAPSWNGTVATLTLTAGLGFSYLKTVTVVSTMINLGDLATAHSNWVETSAAGTYNEGGYPPTLYNIGTITESWTLTFTSSTAFAVSGANVGTVGAGAISGDFSPVNGASYYFKIDANGWGGSWVSGDKITFNTVHAGAGIWLKEVVAPGISGYANNTIELSWKGESAP